MASFRRAASAIDASIPLGRAEGEGNDSLPGIENLEGSGQGDRLVGDAAPNLIKAGRGDDVVAGGGGNDRLVGSRGDDGFDICKNGEINSDECDEIRPLP